MSQQYTLSEVAKHNKEGDIWVVIHGKVYDLSKFSKHPGTLTPLLKNAGTDATEKFEAVEHSDNARTWMKDFEIGEVKKEGKCPFNVVAHWKYYLLGAVLTAAIKIIYELNI